jgi:hypothetical protein
MGGTGSACGGEESCIRGVGVETQGKEPLERHSRRGEDNIKMDLPEVGCGVMDYIELAQDLHKYPPPVPRKRWRVLVGIFLTI